MAPGEQQQILVTATWSDGRVEDVTGTAQFDALNDAVAARHARRPGHRARAAARRTSWSASAARPPSCKSRCPTPSSTPIPTSPSEQLHRREARREVEGPRPDAVAACARTRSSSAASISTRIGTLPTPDEVRGVPRRQDRRQAAQGDRQGSRPARVRRLLGAQVGRPAAHQPRPRCKRRACGASTTGCGPALRDNKPVDEFVRDIITAEGSTFTEGPANFYQIARNAADWAETTAQLFLGVRMQLRQVPPPPVREVEPGRLLRHGRVLRPAGHEEQPGVRHLRPRDGRLPQASRRADAPAQGRRGQAAPARRRGDGRPVRPPAQARGLADGAGQPVLRPQPGQPLLGLHMGRGLVEPLDDMRATNPASNPGAARRPRRRLRQEQVRPEAPAADDHELAGLPAQLDGDAGQQAGRRQRPLHALHGASG